MRKNREQTNNGLGRLVKWDVVLLELRRWGWGTSEVAKKLNLPRETVMKWLTHGSEPAFSSGFFLMRLHARIERQHLSIAQRQSANDRLFLKWFREHQRIEDAIERQERNCGEGDLAGAAPVHRQRQEHERSRDALQPA